MATANIFEMTLANTLTNKMNTFALNAIEASKAYQNFYGYVFYTGNTMEVSEDNGWSLMEQNDWCDDEEGYWASIDAAKFDSELYWDNLLA